MNPDLYGAWLAAAALAVFAAWAIRRALRDANQRVAAILADLDNQPRKEKPQP